MPYVASCAPGATLWSAQALHPVWLGKKKGRLDACVPWPLRTPPGPRPDLPACTYSLAWRSATAGLPATGPIHMCGQDALHQRARSATSHQPLSSSASSDACMDVVIHRRPALDWVMLSPSSCLHCRLQQTSLLCCTHRLKFIIRCVIHVRAPAVVSHGAGRARTLMLAAHTWYAPVSSASCIVPTHVTAPHRSTRSPLPALPALRRCCSM